MIKQAIIILWLTTTPGLTADLPNPKLTPGVVRYDLTLQQVCSIRWGKDRRHVTAVMRRAVLASYRTVPCKNIELDHLIPRELGGADHVNNLWPQCYTGVWNAYMKDRLENRLHKEACAGNILIKDAQEQLRTDWRVTYRRYFGHQ